MSRLRAFCRVIGDWIDQQLNAPADRARRRDEVLLDLLRRQPTGLEHLPDELCQQKAPLRLGQFRQPNTADLDIPAAQPLAVSVEFGKKIDQALLGNIQQLRRPTEGERAEWNETVNFYRTKVHFGFCPQPFELDRMTDDGGPCI